jgi:hypothetical protein
MTQDNPKAAQDGFWYNIKLVNPIQRPVTWTGNRPWIFMVEKGSQYAPK